MSSSEGEDLDIEDFLEVRNLATLLAPETAINKTATAFCGFFDGKLNK